MTPSNETVLDDVNAPTEGEQEAPAKDQDALDELKAAIEEKYKAKKASRREAQAKADQLHEEFRQKFDALVAESTEFLSLIADVPTADGVTVTVKGNLISFDIEARRNHPETGAEELHDCGVHVLVPMGQQLSQTLGMASMTLSAVKEGSKH
jgi:hypothetical protein